MYWLISIMFCLSGVMATSNNAETGSAIAPLNPFHIQKEQAAIAHDLSTETTVRRLALTTSAAGIAGLAYFAYKHHYASSEPVFGPQPAIQIPDSSLAAGSSAGVLGSLAQDIAKNLTLQVMAAIILRPLEPLLGSLRDQLHETLVPLFAQTTLADYANKLEPTRELQGIKSQVPPYGETILVLGTTLVSKMEHIIAFMHYILSRHKETARVAPSLGKAQIQRITDLTNEFIDQLNYELIDSSSKNSLGALCDGYWLQVSPLLDSFITLYE